MIKDSGERQEFITGAVRDMAVGKGDMASLPPDALLRLSKHLENGAKKYGRWNYLRGIPVSSFIDSALRHLCEYLAGYDDEDHLGAAAFNVLGALQMEEAHPELVDIPTRIKSPAPHSCADCSQAAVYDDQQCCDCLGNGLRHWVAKEADQCE